MPDPVLSLAYFPIAVGLGILHALEPGHAKTLTAAYLIGIKGTRRDAVVLGLAVATTHSFVVIAIAVGGLLLGSKALAGEAQWWLQMTSAVVVIAIGLWLAWRRRPRTRPLLRNLHILADTGKTPGFAVMAAQTPLHVQHHHHDDLDEDAHAAAHAAAMPAYVTDGGRPSLWQIAAFGAAGGMIPCPASISVLLLSLSVGQIMVGLALVAGFSLGLALALVGVGLAVVAGYQKLTSGGRLAWLSRHALFISSLLVLATGVAALAMCLLGGTPHH